MLFLFNTRFPICVELYCPTIVISLTQLKKWEGQQTSQSRFLRIQAFKLKYFIHGDLLAYTLCALVCPEEFFCIILISTVDYVDDFIALDSLLLRMAEAQ